MQKQLLLKILAITFLALVLLIPLSQIRGIITERVHFKYDAIDEVAASWTGEQVISTPILVIEYTVPAVVQNGFKTETTKPRVLKRQVRFADNFNVTSTVNNDTLSKGIFSISTYTSVIKITGSFAKTAISQAIANIKKQHTDADITSIYLNTSLSDTRGIIGEPTLSVNGQNVTLKPGNRVNVLGGGFHTEIVNGATPAKDLAIELTLNVKGMNEFSLLPLANTTTIAMQSGWPHPKFKGAALPIDRNISSEGFNAEWASSWFSNNALSSLNNCIQKNSCGDTLAQHAVGVEFIETVDIYTMSERSLKYAILFIVISFAGFFIVENIKGIRIHPVQYGFVGVSLAVFFLLLIALTEHMAFHFAYLISMIACVGLLGLYTRYVLQQLSAAITYALGSLMLFGLLFGIIRSEDYALLMGSLLVFGCLALMMWFTRKMDWYALQGSVGDKVVKKDKVEDSVVVE